jgi:hypothetical protein
MSDDARGLRRLRVSQDDYAMGIVCLLFCGGLGALAAPASVGSACLVALGLFLLSVAAIWAARDAHDLPDEVWQEAGRSKRIWVNVLLFLAPLGIGGLAAIAYFAAVRPQLEGAEPPSEPSSED